MSFDRYPTGLKNSPLVANAIYAGGHDDLGALRRAGAFPLGTMWMKGRDAERVRLAAAAEAAALGGTHYAAGALAGRALEFRMWIVEPRAPRDGEAPFVVLRVEAASWHRLPPGLQPSSTR